MGYDLLLFKTYGDAEPPAWSPLDIASLLAWYDMSDASTITESGGSVSQLDDKSGNGYHATQGTASLQPTTGTRTINSLNVLDFTNDSLNLPSGVFNAPTGDNTIIVCLYGDSFNLNRIWNGLNSLNQVRWAFNYNSGYGGIIGINSATTWDPVTGVTLNAGGTRIISFQRESSTVRIYNHYTGSTNSKSTNVSNPVITSATIGSHLGTTDFYDGVLCEIIVYEKALTDEEYDQVGNYLATKWGTTWTNIV